MEVYRVTEVNTYV